MVLVVVAALVAIAIPAAGYVLNRAREIQAKAVMERLSDAIHGYKEIYHHYPQVVESSGDVTFDTSAPCELFNILAPPATTNPPEKNPKGITFFDTMPRKGFAGVTASGGLLDPWGSPYHIRMDTDGDGFVDNPFADQKDESPKLPLGAIIWSSGPDYGNSNRNHADDLKSWK